MTGYQKRSILILCISIFILSACGIGDIAQFGKKPAEQPAISLTLEPTPTKVILPTVIPTKTETPKPTQTACNADLLLQNIKAMVPYEEFAAFYYTSEGISSLNVWIVDPGIDSATESDEMGVTLYTAIEHALILTQEINLSDKCVSDTFNKISIIMVDQTYHPWYDAEIYTSLLPTKLEKSPDKLESLRNRFQVSYFRKIPVGDDEKAPAGSCIWKNTNLKLHTHFDVERENVAFFYTIHENEILVFAQWDGTAEDLDVNYLESLLNVSKEIKCLHPEPEFIYYQIVDETGDVLGWGQWTLKDPKKPDLDDNRFFYAE
ncbi:MAG: hypothetical protein JEZ00_06850 [Anaerolineaceae bacterium]|nr:hypothetical protein [Anaerolineaceae bacterium]